MSIHLFPSLSRQVSRRYGGVVRVSLCNPTCYKADPRWPEFLYGFDREDTYSIWRGRDAVPRNLRWATRRPFSIWDKG